MEIVLVWFIFSILAGVFAASRGRSGFGYFLLALFLSPLIAFVVILIVQKKPTAAERVAAEVTAANSKKCPFCAENIKSEAKVCRYCGRDLPDRQETSVANEEEKPGQVQQAAISHRTSLLIVSGVLVALAVIGGAFQRAQRDAVIGGASQRAQRDAMPDIDVSGEIQEIRTLLSEGKYQDAYGRAHVLQQEESLYEPGLFVCDSSALEVAVRVAVAVKRQLSRCLLFGVKCAARVTPEASEGWQLELALGPIG